MSVSHRLCDKRWGQCLVGEIEFQEQWSGPILLVASTGYTILGFYLADAALLALTHHPRATYLTRWLVLTTACWCNESRGRLGGAAGLQDPRGENDADVVKRELSSRGDNWIGSGFNLPHRHMAWTRHVWHVWLLTVSSCCSQQHIPHWGKLCDFRAFYLPLNLCRSSRRPKAFTDIISKCSFVLSCKTSKQQRITAGSSIVGFSACGSTWEHCLPLHPSWRTRGWK